MARDARPGVCTCLRCGREWESPDKRRIRICPRCKQLQREAINHRYGVHAEPRGRVAVAPGGWGLH